MNDQQKISRGKFMGLVGGMALTAILFKISSVKNVVAAVSKAKSGLVTGSYGNHTYGGKKIG
jgi:hypothetical protein